MSSEVKIETPAIPTTPAATETPAATPEVKVTSETPAVPATTPAATPAKPKENYEHLLRESNKVRKLQKELKDKEARIAEKEKEMELLDKDPWALLNKKGVTYEALIDRIVKGEAPKTAAPQPNKDLEDIKNKLLELDHQKTQEQARSYAMWLKNNIDANKERWELITSTNKYQLVLDKITDAFAKSGEELPYEKVADAVERFLEDTYSKDIDYLLKTKKIRSKFDLVNKTNTQDPKNEVKKEPEVKQASEQVDSGLDDEWKKIIAERRAARLSTLSNSNTSSNATGEQKPLTREERKKLALSRHGDKLIS